MGETAQHILKDLGAKLGQDISDCCQRTMMLAEQPKDQFVVGTYGAATAIAWAAAALNEMLGAEASPEDCVTELLNVLRPMVLSTLKENHP